MGVLSSECLDIELLRVSDNQSFKPRTRQRIRQLLYLTHEARLHECSYRRPI